ncbi:ABC transporter permease [Pseudobdellovibrio sp. HCB154]|uniref:ABC transporter permease n=1 Tax=Pseudobdellovibrio sp. HCB154 TaxID=3386277 RepID=UPI00391742BE
MKRIDFSSLIGFFIGVALSSVLVILFKENPGDVLKVLSGSFLQSKFDMGLTLFYTTCFAFAGLAFSIPFKAGLFHIGAEGQIVLSAMMAAVMGIILPESLGTFGIVLICLATMVIGILSAQTIAFFKVYKQGHEVVVAIMLNFIFAAIATYVILQNYQNPESQNPESALINPVFQGAKADSIKTFFEQSAVSSFLLLAVLSCLAVWFFEKKTKWGMEIKAYGENPTAAERMGISAKKVNFLALGIAGFFSSLVGLTEVLGSTFQYKVGFSPAYGFLGIVVALLAQGHPMGILFSSFIMAVLHKGASDLDLETQFLTRDFSKVLQAIIIFCVAGAVYLNHRRKKV